jgi:deoxycytidylate deaminase
MSQIICGVFYEANKYNPYYSKSYLKRNIHIAYILQGGKVISMSSNSLRSMTGLNYNHIHTNTTACHAEMACIKNIKYCNREKILKRKLTLYSLSFKVISDTNSKIIKYKLQSGKPCRSCAYNLIRFNIKKIWYSDNNSEIKELLLNEYSASLSNVSSGSIINVNFNKIYNSFSYTLFNMIKDNKYKSLILPRKKTIFNINKNCIVLLQFTNKNKKYNIKVLIKNTDIDASYHNLVRKIQNSYTYKNNLNMYKQILKKSKTYILIDYVIIK